MRPWDWCCSAETAREFHAETGLSSSRAWAGGLCGEEDTVSDHHSREEPDARDIARLDAGRLMTSKAMAIAAFAFAVFSMMGQGSWSIALTALFWGANYQAGAVPNVMVVWGIGCLVTAGIGAWLARAPSGWWTRRGTHIWRAPQPWSPQPVRYS